MDAAHPTAQGHLCAYQALADAAQNLQGCLARLAAAHKDALDTRAGEEAAQLLRGDKVCRSIFFLEGEAALAIQNCTVAGQVDYMRLELAHLLLELLKGALVAGIEGHVLTINGPKQCFFFFFIVQSRKIRGRAGHEEQAQRSGSQLSSEGGHLPGGRGKAADSEEWIDAEKVAFMRKQELPGEVEDLGNV